MDGYAAPGDMQKAKGETAMREDFNYKGENAILKGMFDVLIQNGMLHQGNASDEEWYNIRDAIEDMFGITIPGSVVLQTAA